MKNNRLEPGDAIGETFKAVPFLGRFTTTNIYSWPTISSKLINDYMGYELVGFQAPVRCAEINILLEEAEKRGDI